MNTTLSHLSQVRDISYQRARYWAEKLFGRTTGEFTPEQVEEILSHYRPWKTRGFDSNHYKDSQSISFAENEHRSFSNNSNNPNSIQSIKDILGMGVDELDRLFTRWSKLPLSIRHTICEELHKATYTVNEVKQDVTKQLGWDSYAF